MFWTIWEYPKVCEGKIDPWHFSGQFLRFITMVLKKSKRIPLIDVHGTTMVLQSLQKIKKELPMKTIGSFMEPKHTVSFILIFLLPKIVRTGGSLALRSKIGGNQLFFFKLKELQSTGN